MVINQYGFGDLVLVLTPSCDYCGLFDPKCAIFNRRICAIFTRCLQLARSALTFTLGVTRRVEFLPTRVRLLWRIRIHVMPHMVLGNDDAIVIYFIVEVIVGVHAFSQLMFGINMDQLIPWRNR